MQLAQTCCTLWNGRLTLLAAGLAVPLLPQQLWLEKQQLSGQLAAAANAWQSICSMACQKQPLLPPTWRCCKR